MEEWGLGSQAWAAIGMIGSIVLYVVVALFSARKVRAASSFYNDTISLRRATLSLACFNVTLGTGIAYLVQQVTYTGWWAMLTPFALVLGYFLFGIYMKSVAFRPSIQVPNIYRLLSEEGGGISLLTRLYSFAIVVTFILVLGFELWLGAELIAKSIFSDPDEILKIVVALILFSVVAVYTSIAGMRGSVNTDMFQALILLAFVVVVFLLIQSEGIGATSSNSAVGFSQSALAVALAIVTAITTQFYSVVNANFGVDYSPEEQGKMFTRAGIISGVYYSVVLMIFLVWGGGTGIQDIAQSIGNETSSVSWVLALTFAAGLVAISLSSLDNATVSISKVVYENWLGWNALQTDDTTSLRKLRTAHFAISILMVVATVALIELQLDFFYTLLTILFAASVFSPILCGAIWLHSHGYTSFVDNKNVVSLAAVAIVGAWYFYFSLNLDGELEKGSFLHLAAVALSLVFMLCDVAFNRNKK